MKPVLLLLSLVALGAAEPSATDITADLVADRAKQVMEAGDEVTAGHLQRLADGVRAKRITLAEAQEVLGVVQRLPSAAPAPVERPRPPSMSAAQATAALDGLAPPPPLPPEPAPAAPPAPPAPVTSAAVPTPAAPPPPVGTPPRVIGRILAIEPGADGKPALVAWATQADAGIKAGDRVAVRRDDASLVLVRVSQVKPDLTIALIIPGTWASDQSEIRLDDAVAVIDGNP